ncbi:uncharacterized protein palb2 isoform X2 [Festucalex cinctus]
MQNGAVWDVLRCEEQLRSTLHCDDKDNLRRKLAQLRKEYVKTAQKLQRAEQLEAARKHVKNDVAPIGVRHRRPDLADPDVASKPTDGASPADSSCSGTARTPLDSTPEQSGDDPALASRASPTPSLRLRSRRSRMRWQRRGEDGGGKSQGEEATMTAATADGSQSSEPASPSLLLSHWNVTPARRAEKREADAPDDVCGSENCAGGRDAGFVVFEEKSPENSVNQSSSCNVESTGGVVGKVEGLLFPAEYYVRTTRRMALSQSRPDPQAVVETQLTSGRPRRKKVCSGEPSSAPTASVGGTPPTRVTRPAKGRRGAGRPSPYPGPSLIEVGSPNSRPTPEEVEPPCDHPKSPPPTGSQKKVFPIFRTTVKSTPVVSSSESWRSLLLLSPRLSPTPPLLPTGQLVGDLSPFDLHQDFHLPDDQFASLKLSKLRQVATQSETEPLASPRLGPATGNSSGRREARFPRDRPPEDDALRDVFPKVEHRHGIDSQLRLSPPAASAPRHPSSPALPSSPPLPSLGLTPLATSPTDAAAAPSPRLRRSARDFSPPMLSPQTSATRKMAAPTPDVRVLVAAEERGSCTLKAPAGSGLVDACCLLDSGGHLCVAAAGKWAVSLWSRASSSCAWTRRHVWPFAEPLINVFPVPDAGGLVCVTVGRPESKQVRVLSCRGGEPVPLLGAGDVQAAVGVAERRVVTSSRSAAGCALRVLPLANDGSASCCLPLASPKVCVTSLAPVDGLPDALIGTDERGRLFVWNLKSGHLLQKMELDDSLSHTTCLRGFSCRGALLVVLQHEFLGCPQTKQDIATGEMLSKQEDEKEPALFSLVAVNPLSGKSVLAARLEPPTSCSGRTHDADVSDVAEAGRSRSGRVRAWQPKRHRDPAAPNGEGWQLARWAEDGSTLLTGHRNGDVTLHFDLSAHDHFMCIFMNTPLEGF